MTMKKEGADKDAGRTPDPSAPKRPYATLDLKATEVKSAENKPDPAKETGSKVEFEIKVDPKAAPKAGDAKAADPAAATSPNAKTADTRPSEPAPAKPAVPPPRKSSGIGGFFSHLAAGIVGGFLALLGADTIGPRIAPQLGWPSASSQMSEATADLRKRIAGLEAAVTAKPSDDAGIGHKLAGLEQRLSLLDEVARTVGALGSEQSRIASEVKSNAEKLSQQPADANAEQRIGKLEDRLRELASAAATDPQSGKLTQLAGITGRIADLEGSLSSQMQVVRKSVAEQIDARLTPIGEASEAARAGVLRVDRDMGQVKTDVARIGQRIEAQKAESDRLGQTLRVLQEETGQLQGTVTSLKGDLDARLKSAAKPADVSAAIAPLTAKIAALEGSVQKVVSSEDTRRSNAERVVLSLELANLKRVVERGQPFAAELAEVRKASGGRLDLGLLETVQDKGVATVAELARDFRSVANRIADAAAEPSEGGVVDRLLAGARSMVRVRKVGHAADDGSVEAIVGRIDQALKDGRLGDAIAQARSLPASVAAQAKDWLARAEARHAVDKAIASVEGQLKASLAGVAAPDATPKN